jgi:RNA polymerase sigma-70 factor (ECF subfamily)
VTFDAVFAELRGPVFKLCFRMLGDRHQAEDASQETFLSVYRGLGGFRGDASLKTWVYRIAVRAALKVRAQRDTAAGPLDESHEEPVRPEPALEARDEARRLRVALASLPAEHRTVLSLSALDGVSHQEIADVLGIPSGTVGSRLHFARKKLMAELHRVR